ncbi:MAG: endolytic transglycosylase MltG [Candidatus Humimicrobiaceae bacterium]
MKKIKDKEINTRLIPIFIILVILSITAASSGCGIFPSSASTKPVIEKGLDVEIEIKEGMNLTQISGLLEEKGIVDSGLFFKIYAEEKGFEKKMMPGTYNLKTGSEYSEVLEFITSVPAIVTFKLAVPEGFLVSQVSERIINELPFIVESELDAAMDPANYSYEFLNDNNAKVESLEGFLFPKTYEVLAEYNAQNVIEMFLSQYQLETSNLDYTFATENDFSAYDILKIASMIEKEAYIPEERTLISSVIHNRLKINMALGIDATLTYFLDKWNSPLTESDLQTDTPYNTRLYAGLMPTPICNPGIESIRAALNPEETDYLYYVVTDEAKHQHSFSRTLEEHNENINGTSSTE